MKSLYIKASNAIRADGIWGAMYRILRYPYARLKTSKTRQKIFSSADPEAIFTKIYETNWWGSPESISGFGSTLAYTENLRLELPGLFQKFSIKSVFDAPCGDFNWMKSVVEATSIDYMGGDIVLQLIQDNLAKYSSERVTFRQFNVINDAFPNAGMWLCRDCLIHFSYADIYRTLQNFIASEIPYILTTSHVNKVGFANTDIKTGDARLLDLFSAPFSFPEEALCRIQDWIKPHPPREMVLFNRDQVMQAMKRMESELQLNSAA